MVGSVAIIGAPFDLGGARRGTHLGPEAVRESNLFDRLGDGGIEFVDLGDLDSPTPDEEEVGDPKARYLDATSRWCAQLRDLVFEQKSGGHLPVVIGGDHSIAIGTIAGMTRWANETRSDLGLIWFDAHGDMNTPETTVTGNIHGMPLACVLGKGPRQLTNLGASTPMVAFDKSVLIGARSIDSRERTIIEEVGIRVIEGDELADLGVVQATELALDIATSGTAGFHLSFDIDGLDPSIAPGVGTPVPGGVSLDEGNEILQMLAESNQMASIEFAELNPVLDIDGRSSALIIDLLMVALGLS